MQKIIKSSKKKENKNKNGSNENSINRNKNETKAKDNSPRCWKKVEIFIKFSELWHILYTENPSPNPQWYISVQLSQILRTFGHWEVD